MHTYVALLRGVNFGGRTRIRMADLRLALEHAGFTSASTLLQTGNVVLRSAASRTTVGDVVEATVQTVFSLDVTVVVRTAEEIHDIVDSGTFNEEQLAEPRLAHVLFCRETPHPERFREMRAEVVGSEMVKLREDEIFVHYAGRATASRITNSFVERRLGTRVTARNWNTVLKIRDRVS